MALVDEVQIHIQSGNGGDGVVRWRREKFQPKGGPNGGNGGRGADVYAEAISDLAYLSLYLRSRNFQAEHGEAGGSRSREGKDGNDLVLKFPRGSVIKNLSTGEEFELAEVGEKLRILKGGRGGLGNEYFKSSTNTTPYEWTPGEPGEEADFLVELKLFADVGFVGFPNAGKSTLLNELTNAKSKIGDYHFTTLDPHLGAMGPYVLADIPGIIEGASSGKGLGYKFLKHIQRTRTLVHLVSLESSEPWEDYRTIRRELENYDQELLRKDEIVVLTKADLLDTKDLEKIIQEFRQKISPEFLFTISAFDNESIKDFQKELWKFLDKKASV